MISEYIQTDVILIHNATGFCSVLLLDNPNQPLYFLWPLLTFLKNNEISHNFYLRHTHFYRYKWTIKIQTIINSAESYMKQHHTEISALTEQYLKTRKTILERGTNQFKSPEALVWQVSKGKVSYLFENTQGNFSEFHLGNSLVMFCLYFPALLFEIDEEKGNGEVDREKQDKTDQSLFFHSSIREEDNISKANLFSCNSLGLFHFPNTFYRKPPFWGTQCLHI